jgi:flagellar protein FlbD
MIHVTRFDGTDLVINSDLIEHVESTPDTVITLVNGKKWVVRETTHEIVRRVLSYQREMRRQPVGAKVIPFSPDIEVHDPGLTGVAEQ